jgi:hypothetical protein
MNMIQVVDFAAWHVECLIIFEAKHTLPWIDLTETRLEHCEMKEKAPWKGAAGAERHVR